MFTYSLFIYSISDVGLTGGGEVIKEEQFCTQKDAIHQSDQHVNKNDVSSAKDSHVSHENKMFTYDDKLKVFQII